MNQLEKYYREKLYPIQDGVIKIVGDLKLPFYLTGDTALSRFYFNHRYSDDLDFFVNRDPDFRDYIKSFLEYFEIPAPETKFILNTERINITNNYAQFFFYQEDIELKIDFVNDLAARFNNVAINKI
jgi:hypothetical protein